MKKLILTAMLPALMCLAAQAQDEDSYPLNYISAYYTIGNFSVESTDLVFEEEYSKIGLGYARRISRRVYIGVKTHKITSDIRYFDLSARFNFLTAYRIQPHVGLSLGTAKELGPTLNICSGIDIHIGRRLVLNTGFTGSLGKYHLFGSYGLTYKF